MGTTKFAKMREDEGFIIIPCFLLLVCLPNHLLVASPSSSSFSCQPDQRHALLRFIHSFSVTDDYFWNTSSPKVASWREDEDCCSWEGVTCHNSTGDIIGLNLTCVGLCGSINSSSSLFSLRGLRSLSLAENDFLGSTVPPEIGVFTQLEYLDLSNSNIAGILPTEISQLSKLFSLDLSENYDLEMEDHTMRMLIQNLTQMEELNLGYVHMSTVSPTSFMNLSSSLISLKLIDCSLGGKFPEFIFGLPNLQEIDLSWNSLLSGSLPKSKWSPRLDYLSLQVCAFTGAVPKSIGNVSRLTLLHLSGNFMGAVPNSIGNLSRLTLLDLSGNNFMGAVPNSIGNLSRLTLLDLSGNNFMGAVPNSIGNISRLTTLDLSVNNFMGAVPYSIGNLSRLTLLHLSRNNFMGAVPNSIGNLSRLTLLDLSGNNFMGAVPYSIGNLSRLTHLELSGNNFTGEFDLGMLSKLRNLYSLDLSGLSVWVEDSNHELPFPQLRELCMASCNLSKFPSFLSRSKELIFLDLSGNKISEIPSWLWSVGIDALEGLHLRNNIMEGSIPPYICQLASLSDIDFGGNKLTGLIPQCLGNLTNLQELHLSNNSLSGTLPSSLANGTSLWTLDVSYNNIGGAPPTSWLSTYLWNLNLQDNNFSGRWPPDIFLRSVFLKSINLSDNKFEGPLPVPYAKTRYYSASNNRFSGEIPSLICIATNLQFLDLSNNSLTGTLPTCLRNITFSLNYLNLRANEFRGLIPEIFQEGSLLTSIDLSKNQFEGSLPRSLSNCEKLEALDIGSNKIGGLFPDWLGDLPLRVLSLRSNNFHGHFSVSGKTRTFSKVQVLDLSKNCFDGNLSNEFIGEMVGMRQDDNYKLSEQYFGWSAYYSVTVDLKGIEIVMVKINVHFAMLDLSSNRFQGEIPRSIRLLKSLKGLNFSHNNFTGMIPPSIGNLTNLEGLDLSSNHLFGEIPKELTKLTFLEFLNLSQNNLTGRIPLGVQFNTFSNSSFEGNPGLCGIPLTRSCVQGHKEAQPPSEGKDNREKEGRGWLEWRYVALGFGTGMGIGISLGYMALEVGRPLWLVRMVNQLEGSCKKRSKRKGAARR